MIPNEVFEIMTKPLVGHLGSRNKAYATTHTFLCGIKLHDNKQTITVYIPESISALQLSNLRDNKITTVFLTDVTTHTAFQFKGEFVSDHAATEEEHALVDGHYRHFYDDYLKAMGYPETFAEGFALKPAVAITFNVNEVYSQTPGPNAGTKIA